MDVFVVGSLHLDVVVDAPRLPALDETLIGSRVAYRFGGKGGNQAVAAAGMGAQVAMAGRVGEDGFADPVRHALRAAGVDQGQVRTVPGATGMSVAIVEAGGEYGAVVVSGVNQTIDPAEVDPGGAKLLLLQNEVCESVNLTVARKTVGTRIVLNAAPARPVAPELLAATDVLIVNRVEAAQMTGVDPAEFDASGATKTLAATGPRAVVLTLGADGALLYERATLTPIPPPYRATGSAHGAGDAYVGALAAELAAGASLHDAATFAAGAAAFFVATSPALRGAITRAEIEAGMSKS